MINYWDSQRSILDSPKLCRVNLTMGKGQRPFIEYKMTNYWDVLKVIEIPLDCRANFTTDKEQGFFSSGQNDKLLRFSEEYFRFPKVCRENLTMGKEKRPFIEYKMTNYWDVLKVTEIPLDCRANFTTDKEQGLFSSEQNDKLHRFTKE